MGYVALGTRPPSRRDRAVGAYVRRELYPHSFGARERIDASTHSGPRVRSAADLAAVPPISLDEVIDPGDYVMRPTRWDLMRSGSPTMRLRTAWASTWGRWHAFLATLEPQYRPVHYFSADGVPVGAAAADLVRLAGLGAEWLRRAGLTSHDSVALVGGAGSGIEAWELSGGTRRAGVPLAVVDDAANAARHGVTVLAGAPAAVADALGDGAWPALRLVILFGPGGNVDPPAGVETRRAWAVPGTRSVWYECRGGAAYGWHTTPAAELIDTDEFGEVIWTGLKWAGTVFLRLRTDVLAERIETATCPGCGHDGPRVFAASARPALARWLLADPRVAEVRLVEGGAEILPVRAGANAKLLAAARAAFPDQTVVVRTKKQWAA